MQTTEETLSSEAGRPDPARLLATLERLLEIDVFDLDAALRQSADLLAGEFPTDKVDVFLLDPATQTLVSRGVSDTPMGRQQTSAGLHLLPLANGGRAVQVFEQGRPFLNGRTDQDVDEVPGIREVLGVRSTVAVPLMVRGATRGVLMSASAEPDVYTDEHTSFLSAVARWLGLIIDRAELIDERTRAATREARRRGSEEVLAAVRHDLRNRITPIRARIEMLGRRSALPAEVVTAMLRDTDALTMLVDTLSEVEEIERGVAVAGTERIELSGLLRDTAAAFASDRVRFEVRGGPVGTVGSRARLQAAIDNLVANAVKHSPDGGTVLLESRSEVRDEHALAVVEVTDQGPGVPAELRPRLFDREVRGPGSTGQGLGLYIADRVVSAHRGRLTLARSDERGSVFRIELPAE